MFDASMPKHSGQVTDKRCKTYPEVGSGQAQLTHVGLGVADPATTALW